MKHLKDIGTDLKIIFLDIDGVLALVHKNRDDYGSLFHQEFVDNLKMIVDKTDAKIVISSSWRKDGLDTILQMWKFRNMPGEVIDITPSITLQRGMIGFYKDISEQRKSEYRGYSIPRGCEISYWLKEEASFQRINWSCEEQIKLLQKSLVKNYVILDDDSDFLLCQKEHFVKCSNNFSHSDSIEGYGLTSAVSHDAIKILNTPLEQLYYGD
jgi:hypothetical protein